MEYFKLALKGFFVTMALILVIIGIKALRNSQE
jgi:hypothetical protein